MICIRLTAKLAKRMKVDLVESSSPTDGSLGDWYVNHYIIGRQHLLLAVSQRTLLPVLLQAKELKTFPERLRSETELILRSFGIAEPRIKTEIKAMGEWVFAKTDSRQVLGSMNDFASMLKYQFNPDASLCEESRLLARTPCSPISGNSPQQETIETFAGNSRPCLILLKS